MLSNFARPREEELTSVVTFTLWRVEGDKDNLMLWLPKFVIGIVNGNIEPDIAMVRAGHELEQPVFVDTTEQLQAFVEKWTKTYEEPKLMLSVNLHRKGKVFTLPQEAIKQG